MFLSWTKNVSPFWLMPGCSHRLNSPTSTLCQCSFCSFEAGTVVAEPNSNSYFRFLKTIHILFEKCQMLSVSIPSSSSPPPPDSPEYVVTLWLFLLCRLVCSGFFFNSFGFYFSPATTQSPATPFSLTWITISKWFVWECGVFIPFCWLKEIDMNNSFIATNEILWMQNPYKLFLVVLLSRCYHRLFV